MDNIISIHYNSDWEFEYPLPASYDNCPFKITLYTIDYEDNRYEAYFDGTSYVNCTKTNNNSIIVHIDNFTFYPGCVRVRVEYFIDSASFNDGIYNGVHTEKTNIYTTKAKSATTAITFEGSSLPNFDAVNIANNVETALNDINEKSEEVEEALSYLSEAQEQVDSILEELNSWVEDNSDLVHRPELSYYALAEDLAPFVTEDEMSDWLSRDYYTKTEVDDAISNHIPDIDLSSYVTKEQLSAQSYLTQHQSLDGYVTDAELADNLAAYATKDYLDGELSSYVSYSYLEGKQYLTQHQSLEEYATMTWVHTQNYLTLNDIDDLGNINVLLDGYVKYEDVDFNSYVTKTQISNAGYITSYALSQMGYLTEHQDLSAYVSKTDLSNAGYLTSHQSLDDYATKAYVLEKLDDIDIQDIDIDLSSYVSKVELSNCGYLTSHQSLDDYATKAYVVEKIHNIEITGGVDLSSYATKNDLNSYVKKSNDDEVVITGDGITLGSIDAINLYADSGVYSYDIYPVTGNGNLGGSSSQWAYTYTKNLILNGTDINDKFPTYAYIEDALQNANVNVDLSAYVTKTQLSNCGYLTSHQSLDNYVTKTQLSNQSYITMANVSACGYLTQHQSLNNYVTKTQLSNCGYLTSHQSLDNYPTYGYVYSYVADAVSGIETTTYEVSYTTYTTQNITIWQGTAAQYAALSNHTAYQLYLIAQS